MGKNNLFRLFRGICFTGEKFIFTKEVYEELKLMSRGEQVRVLEWWLIFEAFFTGFIVVSLAIFYNICFKFFGFGYFFMDEFLDYFYNLRFILYDFFSYVYGLCTIYSGKEDIFLFLLMGLVIQICSYIVLLIFSIPDKLGFVKLNESLDDGSDMLNSDGEDEVSSLNFFILSTGFFFLFTCFSFLSSFKITYNLPYFLTTHGGFTIDGNHTIHTLTYLFRSRHFSVDFNDYDHFALVYFRPEVHFLYLKNMLFYYEMGKTGLAFNFLTTIDLTDFLYFINRVPLNTIWDFSWIFWSLLLEVDDVIFIAIDGISLWLVILTTFITTLVLWGTVWTVRKYRFHYVILILIVELLLLLSFTTLNLFWFYIFFESIVIPLFILIGLCGSRERRVRAGYLFFFFTLFGSILMLVGIILLRNLMNFEGTCILFLYEKLQYLDLKLLKFFGVVFTMGFIVKVPMVPFHFWLPEAHVEAPTGGSILLAGLLLKLGTYGFIRFVLFLFPFLILDMLGYIIMVLGVFGILYASCVLLVQLDIKRIIAYSSVIHMCLVMVALVSNTVEAFDGAYFSMISHGLVSSGLFFCVGVLYEQHGTRLLVYYSGLVDIMSRFFVFFFILVMANISLPGTCSFIAEFLMFLGILRENFILLLFVILIIVIGVACMMIFFSKIAFGYQTIILNNKVVDVNDMEGFILFTLCFFVILLGFFPNIVLDDINQCFLNNMYFGWSY